MPPAPAGDAKAHVFGDPNLWQWAPSRTYHVVNYKLGLRFDQAKAEVFGDEVVTLRPFEPRFHRFYLDSSGLKIDSVALEPAHGAPVKLTYVTEDPHLWITLDGDYDAGSTLQVRVVYHGFPRDGLFFVNPTAAYPRWPREIWSQGETETNHYWFPCWDYPNDMATSETITTVPDGLSVVSNGKLVKVTHSEGQATYDWVESIPHSSYLTSVAVGPWRKISEHYENKPVDYYVPKSVDQATALRSFHLTPDMIAFFSRATGVDYPYEQYAQVTVHNYLYGGMENVSATTLTEWTLHDEPADQDYPSTELVSHELGQHWFGDLVQGRDWANIWLNEGFATYLSALYTQYHEGNDAYRFEIYQDQLAEQAQDRVDYRRPIVDRHYTDPLQMFDAITHQKGAAVLEMMRYLIDGSGAEMRPASQQEPFFQALRYYLTAHRAQTADSADLMEAIRKTTGRELSWFFHEWVFMAGHPDYRVEAAYDSAKRTEKLTVRQMQQTDALTPIFDMPIEFAFYGANGEHKRIRVHDHLAHQEFDVPLDFQPLWVDFDPDDFIDKTIEFDQPAGALIAEAEKDPSMMSRLWAVQQLGGKSDAGSGGIVEALTRVLNGDSFYGVRAAAAASLGRIRMDQAKGALLAAMRQPDSRVRTAVVEALGRFIKDPPVYDAIASALHKDTSYSVEAAAAEGIGRSSKAQAFDVLHAEVSANPEVDVMLATLDGLAATKDPRAAAILLAEAQPGVPERIRLRALTGLTGLATIVAPEQEEEIASAARKAIDDPFRPVQQAGRQLVAILGQKR